MYSLDTQKLEVDIFEFTFLLYIRCNITSKRYFSQNNVINGCLALVRGETATGKFIQQELRCREHQEGNIADSRASKRWEKDILAVLFILWEWRFNISWSLRDTAILGEVWERSICRYARFIPSYARPNFPTCKNLESRVEFPLEN